MPGRLESVAAQQLLVLVHAAIAERANVLNESNMAAVRTAVNAGLAG